MSTAGSIALIFLIIEASIVSLVFLALFAGMVYGMYKLRGVVKRVMPRLQGLTYQVYTIARTISDKIAAPFLWAHATNANVRAVAGNAKRRVRYHVRVRD